MGNRREEFFFEFNAKEMALMAEFVAGLVKAGVKYEVTKEAIGFAINLTGGF